MRTPFRRFRSFRKAGWLLVAALLCAASLTTVLAAAGSFGKPAAPMGFQTPAVLSLTLSPSTIAGGSGGSSTGTVTLNGPAPAGGAVVTLASSNIELAAIAAERHGTGRRHQRDLYRRDQRQLPRL